MAMTITAITSTNDAGQEHTAFNQLFHKHIVEFKASPHLFVQNQDGCTADARLVPVNGALHMRLMGHCGVSGRIDGGLDWRLCQQRQQRGEQWSSPQLGLCCTVTSVCDSGQAAGCNTRYDTQTINEVHNNCQEECAPWWLPRVLADWPWRDSSHNRNCGEHC